MRVMSRVLVAAFAGLLIASPGTGQRRDDQIAPLSVQLMQRGEGLIAAGKFSEAEDALETALVVDPRNRFAYVALARSATKQKLYGKAIRLTNRALQLDPNDRDAIAVQGQAMAELGAVVPARANLAKLQKLCGGDCPQAASLSASISRAPAVAVATTPEPAKPN